MKQASPANALLLDAALERPARSWFVPGGPAGLVESLAAEHPEATIHWQPIDIREVRAGAGLAVAVEEPGTPVEGVLIVAAPDRDLTRRWLLEARRALTPGGQLLLAGANAEGIRSAIADGTALFGPPPRETYRAKQRLALFTSGVGAPPEPPWASEPGVAPGTWAEFELALSGRSVALVTRAGVFAGAQVDPGTRLLLEQLPAFASGRVLDVGCGAGTIGLAAALTGADRADLTDASLLAVQAAAENLRRLGLDRCRAFAGDVYDGPVTGSYDLILSNPPFHRGKAVDASVAGRLIDEAPDHLAPGGSLLLVANAFLAYGKRMERVFRTVETVAATRQYHVLRGSDPLAAGRL